MPLATSPSTSSSRGAEQRLEISFRQFPGNLDSKGVGQDAIHEGDIELLFFEQHECFGSVRGLADHENVRLGRDRNDQAKADHEVVIDD